MRVEDRLFIGGEWVSPATDATLPVISPYTEEQIAQVPEGREPDIDRAVAAARAALEDGPWSRMTSADRGELLGAIAGGLQDRVEEMAQVITDEVGSPISFSRALQAGAPVAIAGAFAGFARDFVTEEQRQGFMGPVRVRREPVGVVGAIVPWNVPMILIMQKLAAALATGCTVVLKPAPETPLNAYVLARILESAGLPPGVVNIVPAGREVGEYLVTHPGVDKITFTGSTAAGRRIASLCGEQMKRVTIEAGGKGAAILLEDVDLSDALPTLLQAAMINNGEACISQNRILAPRGRYDEVVGAVCAAVGHLQVGDPHDENTHVGPLFAERHRTRVEDYLTVGKEEGATVAAGGGRPVNEPRGWFVEPTVFSNVDSSMRIAQEEIFGPVVTVIPFDDDDDAVRIANDTIYGLSSSVWSADVDRALDVARRVRMGMMAINDFRVEFDAPFGGCKQSGLGRECGVESLEHFLEYKTMSLPAA